MSTIKENDLENRMGGTATTEEDKATGKSECVYTLFPDAAPDKISWGMEQPTTELHGSSTSIEVQETESLCQTLYPSTYKKLKEFEKQLLNIKENGGDIAVLKALVRTWH